MKTPRRAHLISLATLWLALGGSAPARAGQLARLQPAGKALDLLAGRLSIRMPAGARLEARQASIMAAPTASADESRVVLDAGKERLVLMVSELFALAGPALEQAVGKEAATRWSSREVTYVVEKITARGLQVLALLPSALRVTGDAAMVLAAYLGSSDGTVQLLRLFVNPAAAKDPKGALGLARRLLATLAPGGRKLQTAAGARRLAGHRALEVRLPAGYIATLQPGPDFQVHHLRKLVPLGQAGPTLGVYLGGHPSYQHTQSRTGAKHTERPGTLLGAKVSWHDWAMGPSGKRRQMAEAIVDLGANLRAHVFYGSDNPAELKELQAIADSLRALQK